MIRWTVTTHRDGNKCVIVLRRNGVYISTDYSRTVYLRRSFFNQTPWLRVQKYVDRYQRIADRRNATEQEMVNIYKTTERAEL